MRYKFREGLQEVVIATIMKEVRSYWLHSCQMLGVWLLRRGPMLGMAAQLPLANHFYL